MTVDIVIVSDNEVNKQFKLLQIRKYIDLNHFYLTCFDIVSSMDVRNIDIKTSTYKNCKQLDSGSLVFASACFTHVHLVIRTLINK